MSMEELCLQAFEKFAAAGNQKPLVSTLLFPNKEVVGTSINPVLHFLVERVLLINLQQQQQDTSLLLTSHQALSLLVALVQQEPKAYQGRILQYMAQESATKVTSVIQNDSPACWDVLMPLLVQQVVGMQTVENAANGAEAVTSARQTIQNLWTIAASSSTMEPSIPEWTLIELIRLWKNVLLPATNNNSKKESSLVVVRCATLWKDSLAWSSSDAQTHQQECRQLFLQSIHSNQEDPLLISTLLDILQEVISHAAAKDTSSLAAWLAATDLVDSLLGYCGTGGNEPDPLVGGSALRLIVSLIPLVQEDQQQQQQPSKLLSAISSFVQNNPSSLSEADRLAVWDALSSLSLPLSLSILEDDPETKSCWLHLRRQGTPKLQAAQIMSWAHALQNSTTPNQSSSACLAFWITLGRENKSHTTTTVDWMVQDVAHTPVAELRIAAYTCLSALIAATGLPGAQLLLAGRPANTNASILDWLLERGTEPTSDAKVAKFALVQTLAASPAKGLWTEAVQTKVETFLRQGPYYVPVQSWDVATE